MVYRQRTVLTGISGAPYVWTVFSRGLGEQDEADALNAFSGEFWAGLAGSVLSSGLTATQESTVVDIDASTGQAVGAFPVSGATVTGTNAGERLPPATQALLRLRSGLYLNGRELRGRWFIPGMVEADNAAGVVDSTARNDIVVAYTGALGEAENIYGAFEIQIYSRTHMTQTGVSVVDVWTQFAVLRSRRD